MRGGINAHRHCVRVVGRDTLIHFEEVAVALLDSRTTEAIDGVAEVEVDGPAGRTDTETHIAYVFRISRCHVARHQVAKTRIAFFEIIEPLGFGDIVWSAGVALFPRYPHAAVVPKALAHQRQLRLVVAGLRNARRMDLRIARIAEIGPAPVATPRCGNVRVFGVRREVEYVGIAARAEQHRIARMPFDLARDEVTNDDAARPAVDDDQVEHFAAGKHLDLTGADLPAHGLIGAEKQLLAGLTARIERPRNLRTTK